MCLPDWGEVDPEGVGGSRSTGREELCVYHPQRIELGGATNRTRCPWGPATVFSSVCIGF